jgi:para-nitrobenzyl esterase
MRFLPFSLIMAASITLDLRAETAPPTKAEEQVSTKSGPITGTAKDGVRIYLGIPFAAAPTGDLRWKAPFAPEKWTEPRACTKYGPACPQPIMAESAFLGLSEKDMSEDCLQLNVWTTAKSKEDKLPVMVWIHGGGFILGKSGQSGYDGAELAKRGVVVVSINYRLGILGFLTHAELDKESPDKFSGNYGMLDQLFALQWVQDNIAPFGGDPGNVTVFGESAGGASICMLMASPLSKGLFHKAIVESGHCMRVTRALRWRAEKRDGQESMEKTHGEYVKRVAGEGVNGELKALRGKPWKEIVAEFKHPPILPGISPLDLVCIDGIFLDRQPSNAFDAGKQMAIPLLIGTVKEEGALFARLAEKEKAGHLLELLTETCGSQTDKVVERYPITDPKDGHRAVGTLVGDWFTVGTRATAIAQARVQTKTYVYEFTHTPPFFAAMDLGCTHGSEVPYVFGVLPVAFGFREGDRKLSNQVIGYWVRFAKTGDPNGGEAEKWPAYDPKTDEYLELDLTPKVNRGYHKKESDFFASLKTKE